MQLIFVLRTVPRNFTQPFFLTTLNTLFPFTRTNRVKRESEIPLMFGQASAAVEQETYSSAQKNMINTNKYYGNPPLISISF